MCLVIYKIIEILNLYSVLPFLLKLGLRGRTSLVLISSVREYFALAIIQHSNIILYVNYKRKINLKKLKIHVLLTLKKKKTRATEDKIMALANKVFAGKQCSNSGLIH